MSLADYSKIVSSEDLSEKEDDIDMESQPALLKARSNFKDCVRRPWVKQRRIEKITILHGIMIVTNLLLAAVLVSTYLSQPREESLIYCTLFVALSCSYYFLTRIILAPLSSLVKSEIQAFKTDDDHLWTGPPNPIIEQNWHEFLQGESPIFTLCWLDLTHSRSDD